MLTIGPSYNNFEYGDEEERGSPVCEIKGVAVSALEQLSPKTSGLNNSVTVIETDDVFHDALTGEENEASDKHIAKTGIEVPKQKTAVTITSLVKDLALRIYSYVGGVLISLYSFNASVLNKLHPKARKPETETDKIVDKIAREALPKSLPKIILNALDFIELKGFMARHKSTKGVYEMVSLFALEFVLNQTGDVVATGVDRLVKSVERIVNKTIEQKDKILQVVETFVLNNTAKTLASINEAYENNKGLEKLSQAEQTVAVLNHLKEKGQLHEAIALLSLEEEQLWAARDQYLAPGQTVHDRILVLSDDKEKNAKEIEALYQLKAIELKVSGAEYAYLTKICDEIFERVLYPNNSFKNDLPIYMRPFAGWIKEKIMLSLSATLSSAISGATDPAKIIQMIIEEHQKKQVLANLNQYLLTHESVDDAIARYSLNADENKIVLMALKDLKAVAKTEVTPNGDYNAVTGAVLHKLAKEVGRVGYSGATGAVEVAEFYGNAVHVAASGAMGIVEWGFSCLEGTGLFGSYAKAAKESVQEYKKTMDTQYDPNTVIEKAIAGQVAGLHQMGLNAFNREGLNDGLNLLPGLIEDAAAPTEISEEHPATLVEQSEKAKRDAKAILKQSIEEQFGKNTIASKAIASGIDPMIDRFSNKRLNLALTYNAIDGAIEALRRLNGDIKE